MTNFPWQAEDFDPPAETALVPVNDPWEPIPECLRRDANNVAPFMRVSPVNNLPTTSQGLALPWGSK